jgi:hypothetical protein
MHRIIREKSATPGEQKNLRIRGRTASDREGPNKLDLLSNINILERSVCDATCDYVCISSQVALMLTL